LLRGFQLYAAPPVVETACRGITFSLNILIIVADKKYYHLIKKILKNCQQLLENLIPFLKLPMIWLVIFHNLEKQFKKTLQLNDRQLGKQMLIVKHLLTIFQYYYDRIKY
jgi:hypothetical protein